MAANQSQVLQALTTLNSTIDTLASQVANDLANSGGAPDEQPVLDLVNSIQSKVTNLIATLPSPSAPPTNTGGSAGIGTTGTGSGTTNTGSGSDSTAGGSGADTVTGGGGSDTVNSGSGNDTTGGGNAGT